MSDTVLILGASGYMGSAFVAECERRGIQHYAASRERDQYDHPVALGRILDSLKPSLVINCAAFITVPSVDLCKNEPEKTWLGNTILPGIIAAACQQREIPMIHLSTGCLFDEQREYSEDDEPTRDLNGYCGFYLKSKLGGEKAVRLNPQCYTLRLRLPFDEVDHPRNYLTKLAGFKNVFDHVNSLSHRGDFVKAALDLWQLKAPFGVYHVANPGCLHVVEMVRWMAASGFIEKCPVFVSNKTTGCRLSIKKLLATGVTIRNVDDAIRDAFKNWRSSHV